MTPRPVLRFVVIGALVAVLLGTAVPPTAGGTWPAVPGGLPPCPPVPAEATTLAPTGRPPIGLPAVGHPSACQARPSRVEPAGAGQLPVPRPGYHHLGATTTGDWSGVLGRLTVRDPAVRTRSYDFVATRFMAKRPTRGGRPGWLEVGWAETGWSGGGAQRIYTFDSSAMSWVFYEAYAIADGDQVWVYLHSEPDGTWRAWLWWGWRWHLLATTEGALGERALVEQYVEVHVDRWTGGEAFSVPPIQVDQVRVRDGSEGPLIGWHAGTVATTTLQNSSSYCLDWHRRYDHWSAGDCAATVQE